MAERLSRAFYRRDAVTVARALLGQKLVRSAHGRRLAGIIVETEAYLGIADKAAHSCNGRRTARNESMWSNGGHAYVYFTYGMHHCLNVVAGQEGNPVAVLLRGVEPVEGIQAMWANRGGDKPETQLCSGPGKLCQAFAISRSLDGIDLVSDGVLTIERARVKAYAPRKIVVTKRVGIGYAEDWVERPLRFYVAGNPHVSKP